MDKTPLVSVVVVTYNSSKYVLETLESIYNQTYSNIELIITDDCSKDNTVEICEEWLDSHKGRFVSTELVTTEKNTGIAGNVNRGYRKATGKWIKAIAGDDVLIEDCVKTNVNYVLLYPNTELLFSKVKFIGDEHVINNHLKLFKYGFFGLSSKEQLYVLLSFNCLPASTLFIRKDVYDNLGGFDESYPFLEDWPFWINALMNGRNISFNNEYTICYRMSESSISLSSSPNPLFEKSIKDFENVFLQRVRKETSILLWMHCKFIKYRMNKPFLIRIILKPIIYINPIYYYLRYLFNKLYL